MNDAAQWICTNLQIRQWAQAPILAVSGHLGFYFPFSNLQKAMAAMILMKVSGLWHLWLSKSELLASFGSAKTSNPVKHGLKGRWPRWPRWPRSRPRASSSKSMIRRLHAAKCCPILTFIPSSFHLCMSFIGMFDMLACRYWRESSWMSKNCW